MMEAVDEVKARHKKELKAQEGSGRKLLKQANKSKTKKAEAESMIAKMDAETKERHRRELEAAESKMLEKFPAPDVGDSAAEVGRGGAEGGSKENGDDAESGVSAAAKGLGSVSLEDRERDERDQKRAKAQRKRDKQREKELERERRIEREKKEGEADPRIAEMEALGAQVAPRGFRVSEIKADGHCLYRAVAEQLSLTGRRPELTEESYLLMRQEAARELRSSPGEYLPFLEGIEEGEAFEQYCKKVEASAEWGGQVELQALCIALEVPMEVLSAVSPPLILGDQYEGSPLRLAYHEHYYALGAHYNSVVPS